MPAPESSLLMAFGETVYAKHCASCHGADGHGMPPDYPPLAANPSIQMQSAVNPIRMVAERRVSSRHRGQPEPYGMPPFAQTLSDDEVAAVVTLYPCRLGQRGSTVSPQQANALRTAPVD